MSEIGLIDVDSHNFPNLSLMKISAYHKAKGDNVEWCVLLKHYDIVYVSKVFGDEYSNMDMTAIQADKIIYGGTGFAMSISDGKEVYEKSKDVILPNEIEHIYPDYDLYPELTKDKAYGFLTRGCPNNCSFCIVSKKEGLISHKVADLSEWWRGQKEIILLDPNILACKQHLELLEQLADSGATVDFCQGLDARFITEKNLEVLSRIKIKALHFAFDFMKNEKRIIKGLELAKKKLKTNDRNAIVYMLTNYDTTIQQDLYRVNTIIKAGYSPDIRIYRKNSLPKKHILRDLQRWCNNRYIFRSCKFFDYVPRKDGRTIREVYKDILVDCEVV
jgi:hypothetical protein